MTRFDGLLFQVFSLKNSRQYALCFAIFCLGFFNLPTSINAVESAEKFIIIDETLKKLEQEKLPQPLLKALNPLLNLFYTSKDEFMKELNQLKNPAPQPHQVDVIIKHALRKNSWLRANGMVFDKKESVFTGNVRGGFPKEGMMFTADKARVVTEDSQRIHKVVLENNVHILQSKRDITANRVTYNRTTQILNLVGNIVIIDKKEGVTLHGDTASLDQPQERIEIRGQSNSNSKQRMKIEYHAKTGGTSADSIASKTDTVQAEQAIFDNKQRKSTFAGNVEIKYPQRQLYMTAGSLVLVFNEQQELVSSHAEQNVCIEQPGRATRADTADIDELKQTIHLEGNFKMSRGTFYMDAPRFTLYLDVEKGEAKGDSETPIRMIFPGDEPTSEQPQKFQQITCR